jgi:hypothetical protein
MPNNLKIEYLKTSLLIPYASNSRTHSDEQVAQIAGSIKEFGFTNPVLIDEQSGIIAGHGRVLAARKLGMETLPCIRLAHLTDAQRRAYVIADNKLALNAGWDEETLKAEIERLMGDGFDIALTGFDADELCKMMGDEASPSSEDVKIKSTFEVIAECENEGHQEMVFNLLNEKEIKCRLSTL